MPVNAPKIDSRDQEVLVEQIQKLALKYCPREYFPEAWKDLSSIQSDKRASALIHIFSRMMEIVISRLNKAPDKNFLTFLDLIGVRISPPRVARAPLTFTLASGANKYSLIPAGTQVATSETKGQEAVVFETEKALTVILPKLVKAISFSPADDKWTDNSSILYDAKQNSSEEVFKGKDLIPHRICLSNKKLFSFKEKTTIILHVELENEIKLPEDIPWEVKWYYYGRDIPNEIPLIATGFMKYPVEQTQVIETRPEIVNLRKSGYIVFSDVSEIAEKTIQSYEEDTGLPKSWSGYWIFAELVYPINEKLPEISKLKASVLVQSPLLLGEGTILSERTAVTGKGISFTKLDKGYLITAANQTRIITSIKNDANLEVNKPFDPKLPEGTIFGYVSPLSPEIAFHNNFELDLTKDFYPFGEKPKFNDTFYIGSKEVFSKAGAKITIIIELSDGIAPPDTTDVKLFWESWDREIKKWMKIGESNKENVINTNDFTDSTNAFKQSGQVEFKCPIIEEIELNGEENYWIRVRIVGGNYGEEASYEEITPETGGDKVWIYKKPTYKPPSIKNLTLSYSFLSDEEDLEAVLTYNNFVYQDQTEIIQKNETFKPFLQITEDTQPALYLAFDENIATLPVTIFFPLIGMTTGARRALIQLVGTGTVSSSNITLTGIGTNFTQKLIIGDSIIAAGQERTVTSISTDTSLTVDLPFIPALRAGTKFTYTPSTDEALDSPFLTWEYWTGRNWLKLKVEDNTINLTKRELVQFLAPPDIAKKSFFGFESEYYWIRARLERGRYASFPKLKALYMNTVWARNQFTVQSEILGNSNGSPGQIFKFSHSPVLPGQEVMVMELSLTEEEKRVLRTEEGNDSIKVIKDDSDKVTGYWARWHEVVHFYFSKPNSRHYVIDRNYGTITFGDGERGMIPPAGKDSIKCSYKAGGGASGNVKAEAITKLRTTFPYIDRVSNPEDADGGSDKEEINKVVERGPQTLKHRNRAVTYEDFVWLVKEASPKVIRVKCLPTTDTFLQNHPGWVTLIIVPESEDQKPVPSQQLIAEIENYISERTATYLISYSSHPSQINLIGPGYLKVWVEATVQFTSISEAKTIEGRIIDTLNQFFHPLYGGPEKKGWEFGRNVYISEVYEVIENTEGVDHVETLVLNASAQIYRVSMEKVKFEISYPEKSIVRTKDDKIKFSLAKSLPKDMDIKTINVAGFKEEDSIILQYGVNRVNLTVRSVSHYESFDILECESAWIENYFPAKDSTVETSNKNVKSFILNNIPAGSDISLVPMKVAILGKGDSVELVTADNLFISDSWEINAVERNMDTIFIDENYLVYSGSHVINKNKADLQKRSA